MAKQVILCVDDESIILNSLEMELNEHLGSSYVFEFAENAADGLSILEKLTEKNLEIAVILTDWLMPNMKGDEFLIEAHKKYPNALKIMLTGQANPAAIQRAKQSANLYKCFPKPWDTEDLMSSIKFGLKKRTPHVHVIE
jgi:DNA-binding NtrC family response regulator